MSALFGNLKSEGLEESQDRLGGFRPLETDIYTGKIKALYAGKSDGGAASLTLIADFNGAEFRETFWITNKKGENFFLNKDDKTKKVPLPGFTIADDLCLIATGVPLSESAFEERTIKLYDYEAKKELPKGVDMLVAAIGQPISLGILKILENKSEKTGTGADAEYTPTAETREINVTDKVYHPEQKLTVAEARQGQTEAKFWDSWLERNKGQTRDKRTIKDGAAGGARTAPPKAGEVAATARKSLFGPKS